MSIQSSEEYEEQGLRLLQAEQPADALKLFEEGIRRFPGDADLTMGTAMAHLRLGDYARSCEILEDLRRTQPRSGETLQALAEAYLSRGMLAEAVRAADEAVEGGPKRVPPDVELLGEPDLTEMLAGFEPAVKHLAFEFVLERLNARRRLRADHSRPEWGPVVRPR